MVNTWIHRIYHLYSFKLFKVCVTVTNRYSRLLGGFTIFSRNNIYDNYNTKKMIKKI